MTSVVESKPFQRRKRDYSYHFDWTYEMNIDVYKCYLKAREDPSLGYMTRLKLYWDILHPELTVFNAKQLRQQATFVETKEDVNTHAKSPHLKLDLITLNTTDNTVDNTMKKNLNDSCHKISSNVLCSSSDQHQNLDGSKQEHFEVNYNISNYANDGNLTEPKTNKKNPKQYYEMVMATGIPVKHFYREAMEQVHSYNSKLLLERRLRMPYIDNQTGLAQQDCHLWVSRVQRCAPLHDGQIYSYPSRRWMVRKRPDFVGASKAIERKTTTDVDDSAERIQEIEKPVSIKEEGSGDAATHIPVTTYEDYYDDEAFDSELDSDEEFGSRKRKRKQGKSNRSNKKSNMAMKFGEKLRAGARDDMGRNEDKKKVYECQICNKQYKNKQRLRYHYEQHNGTEVPPVSDQPPVDHVAGAKREKGMPPSSYCDFCLGNADMNKKSGTSEELISCADCGRSGHPSCLQFNEMLTEQVKKYKWQCIECKCCCLCGTSDNDEQLLFCDDCDRGYHMYCLSPPISEPPEGSWQCQLCEARVKGEDISKVSVLPRHMDFGMEKTTSSVTSETESGPANTPPVESLTRHSEPASSSQDMPHTSLHSATGRDTNTTVPNSVATLTSGHPPMYFGGSMSTRAPQRTPYDGRPQGAPRHAMHHRPPYIPPHAPQYPPQYPPLYQPQYTSQHASQYTSQHASQYPAQIMSSYLTQHSTPYAQQHAPPYPSYNGSQHPSQQPPQRAPHRTSQYPPHSVEHPPPPPPAQSSQLANSQQPPFHASKNASLNGTSHTSPRASPHPSPYASPRATQPHVTQTSEDTQKQPAEISLSLPSSSIPPAPAEASQPSPEASQPSPEAPQPSAEASQPSAEASQPWADPTPRQASVPTVDTSAAEEPVTTASI